jgi:hypothetical protein
MSSPFAGSFEERGGESENERREREERERHEQRATLLVKTWVNRQLPERDYLLGNVLCTTSRWLIFGDTGVGKTLFAMAIGGAVASGKPFLKWIGRRQARVMYLDGELPGETFKERMVMVARAWGEDIAFFGYSRDALTVDDMPALNTEEGAKWLWDEIRRVRPDLIIFDSIMCLLIGKMGDEESWAPMKRLIRQLSARRVAQIWLNHTGHDADRSFGTKTKEWEMDTVVGLLKVDEDNPVDTTMQVEFRKSRLKRPETALEFSSVTVRLVGDEWIIEGAAKARSRKRGAHDTIQVAVLDAYDRLADSVDRRLGFNGKPVLKVSVDRLREEVRNRGFLDTDDRRNITDASRKSFSRAKASLLACERLIEADGLIWRPEIPRDGHAYT